MHSRGQPVLRGRIGGGGCAGPIGAAAALLLAVAGCGGRNASSSETDGGLDDRDADLPPDAAPIPTSYAAEQEESAAAACNAPHGNPYTPTDATDCWNRLVGAWYLCSTTGIGWDSGTPPLLSVILNENGELQYLLPDGDGGLVAGRGLEYQGDWSIGVYCNGGLQASDAACDGQEQLLLAESVNGGGGGGVVHFEESPLRLQLGNFSGPAAAWYVPLPRQ
jgi:hypothetical protein